MRHILDIMLPVFIMKSERSFLHPLVIILFFSLQNLFLDIVFHDCVLLDLV
jgi:hypothetical protein